VELGIPVVHAAVTGKSTIIDNEGSFSATTDLGTQEIFFGGLGPSVSTPYATIGNAVMYLAAIIGIVTWLRIRRLVVSEDLVTTEED
jgi:apolipoprotein N-acyltransferase